MDLLLAFDGQRYDLVLDGSDLAVDQGLYTAVALSLFTDARAGADDVLPGEESDRRGWWADGFADIAGDRIGSRLWLLGREKHLPGVAATARRYAEEALAWLVADGIARAVAVQAELAPGGRLDLAVTIERPSGAAPLTYRYVWEALSAV